MFVWLCMTDAEEERQLPVFVRDFFKIFMHLFKSNTPTWSRTKHTKTSSNAYNPDNVANTKLQMGKLKVNTWMSVCVTDISTQVLSGGFTKQKRRPSETKDVERFSEKENKWSPTNLEGRR